ncbi:unnamed protein product [Cyprideis torosa]|uniref:Uncharacterized protein n=1 Tax=Cyprideis torosa TaxID=163714 RepID=A0A7R8WD70_9CRUS|nr:unnamed protein product [Cyprideis torosa]CAG0894354.1 unnamed protein product [Cyprideis torosa]
MTEKPRQLRLRPKYYHHHTVGDRCFLPGTSTVNHFNFTRTPAFFEGLLNLLQVTQGFLNLLEVTQFSVMEIQGTETWDFRNLTKATQEMKMEDFKLTKDSDTLKE